MSTITKNWSIDKIRYIISKLDKKTGLNGAALLIDFKCYGYRLGEYRPTQPKSFGIVVKIAVSHHSPHPVAWCKTVSRCRVFCPLGYSSALRFHSSSDSCKESRRSALMSPLTDKPRSCACASTRAFFPFGIVTARRSYAFSLYALVHSVCFFGIVHLPILIT